MRTITCLFLLASCFSFASEHETSPLKKTEEASDPCRQQGIKTISRPYYPESSEKSGKQFEFNFLHYRKAKEGKPTVLILPGGPGIPSIMYAKEYAILFPKDFGLVFVDPRGIGCNTPQDEKTFPVDFYNTKSIALDALAIVKDLKLNNYMLYGESYGTVTATVASHLAEKEKMARPSALVLDGTLARSFKPKEMFAGFSQRWDEIFKTFPVSLKKKFKEKPLPLGLSATEWGTWLAGQMNFNERPPAESGAIRYPGFERLNVLAEGTDAEKESFRKDILKTLKEVNEPEPHGQKMYQQIACHEFSSDVLSTNGNEFLLADGKLIGQSGDTCKGIKLDHPFDIANYKTTTPIFYVHGKKDPATPDFQLEHHIQSQTSADRVVIEAAEGGHSPLVVSLVDAGPGIWESIYNGGKNLKEKLRDSPFKTEVRAFPKKE